MKNRELALGWMTLPQALPMELIDAAVTNEIREVSIRLRPPMSDPRPAIADDKTLLREIAAALRHHGLHLYNMGGLWLDGVKPRSCYRPALEAGAALGTSHVVTILTEPDANKGLDNFCELCDIAAEHGLKVAVEFVVYSQIKTIEDAVALVRASGRANAGILVDSLHLNRSGGSAQSVRAVPAELVSIVQLCDAPAAAPTTTAGLQHEARLNRLDPGDGGLPLHDFVHAIPPMLPLELEVPNASLSAIAPAQRVRKLVERTRRLLSEADEQRPAAPH